MKTIKRILFISLSFVLLISAGEKTEEKESVFQLSLAQSLNITKKDKIVLAKMSQESLTTQAKDAGISNVIFEGSPQYTKDEDKIRVDIVWTTIRTPDTQKKEILAIPIVSKFRTKNLVIPINTSFNAKGNVEELSEIIGILLQEEQITYNDSSSSSSDSNNSNNDSSSSSSSSSSSDYSSSSSGSLDSTSSTYTNGTIDGTGVLTQTQGMTCLLRIAYDESKAYVQSAQLTGSSCQDTGETIAFTKEMDKSCGLSYDHSIKKAYKQYKEYVEYNGEKTEVKGCTADKSATISYTKVYEETKCPLVADTGAKKAFIQYKEYVEDNWTSNETKQVEVTGCTNDRSKYYSMTSTKETCGIRADFNKNLAYVQEKWQYTDSEKKTHDATVCIDSTESYSIFSTKETCTNKQVADTYFIYERKAYKNGKNENVYVSECEPAQKFAVQKEVCEDKYEHDFELQQSFVRVKNYYTYNNERYDLTDCVRDTTQSFQHEYNTEGCSVLNDDSSLSYRVQAKIAINTKDDGLMTLSNTCTPIKESIPYTLIGTEEKKIGLTANTTWTVPSFVKQAKVLLVAGGRNGTNVTTRQDAKTRTKTRCWISCGFYYWGDKAFHGCACASYGISSCNDANLSYCSEAVNASTACSYYYSSTYTNSFNQQYPSFAGYGDSFTKCSVTSSSSYNETYYTTVCAANGTAGADGAFYQDSISLLPNENIEITVGAANQDTYFGNYASAVGTGTGYENYGKGGAAGVCGGSTSGGAGTTGYAQITYDRPKYQRGDSSIYILEM